MKRLINTLYITTEGAYLSQEGETVVVHVDHEVKLRVPVHTLGGIVCFGQVSCSPYLMHLCAEKNVGISYLSENGRFLARVQGPVSGNVLLRREQYRKADDLEQTSDMARIIIAAKLANSRTVLMRAARERDEEDEVFQQISAAANHLVALIRGLERPQPVDQARGVEGDGARTYFGVFDHLITAQKCDFFFRGRSRRPPMDRVNALLSFVYTLLAHDAESALEGVGLDPAVGFLHRDRPGRAGLALDLMEEFRPFLADRLALSLINRQQVKGKGFTETESGAITMDDDTRKELLVNYQKRKQEEIYHPFLGERLTMGLLIHAQALLMARFIRGDIEAYPPFLWK